MNRWLELGEVEGFDRFTAICKGCGAALPVQGKRVPISRSRFNAMDLRCPNCNSKIDRKTLKSIDQRARGLVGRCDECNEWLTIELREDA
jgi:DNA-directed RNA polymerase subunit RPC12/RpoP